MLTSKLPAPAVNCNEEMVGKVAENVARLAVPKVRFMSAFIADTLGLLVYSRVIPWVIVPPVKLILASGASRSV